MNASMHNGHYERGNAVTLTLLGLSVAILAGIAVLYYIGKTKPEPIFVARPAEEGTSTEATENDPRAGWNTYVDSMYDFSIEFPNGWVVATGTLSTGDPVVSVYKAMGTSTNMVYSHQDVVSHVSVYPLGIAAEGIVGVMEPSKVIVTVPQASAKDYVLESGRPWATKAVFDVYPESWNASGFLFARSKIQEEEIKYMRGDTQIAQYEFDPFTGDSIVRSGFIDTQEREVEEEILRSFSFKDEKTQGSEAQGKTITIEAPKAGEVIKNPLVVRGSIPGGWYFEDTLATAWLKTDDGTIVAEALVVPVENGGTQDAMQFEISLVFETPTATSGKLAIGEKEKGGTATEGSFVEIPVLFTDLQEVPPVDEQ